MNHEILNRRRSKIQDHLSDNDVAIFFSGRRIRRSEDQDYPFSVNRNFYYLTNIDEPNCILVIQKSFCELYINDQTKVENKWIVDYLSYADAKKLSGLNAGFLHENKNYNLDVNTFNKIYLDLTNSNSHTCNCDNESIYNQTKVKTKIENIWEFLATLRSVKDIVEIEKIQSAIDITELGIKNVLKNLKNNKYEYEVEADFIYEIKNNNSFPSFETIIASGLNSTILHYSKNNCELKKGSLVLCDLGAQNNLYCADITRTFPIDGKFSARQKVFYEIVLEAQKYIISKIKPKVTIMELNNLCIDYYYEKLKEINFIKTKEEVSKYCFHSVSHSLGLDTHDVYLNKKDKLEVGNIITVEPGLYIPNESIGVRIEDDILVTKNGCEVLSKNIIKEIDEIEAFLMSK